MGLHISIYVNERIYYNLSYGTLVTSNTVHNNTVGFILE